MNRDDDDERAEGHRAFMAQMRKAGDDSRTLNDKTAAMLDEHYRIAIARSKPKEDDDGNAT